MTEEPISPDDLQAPTEPRRHSVDALRSFLDRANAQTTWHRQRSENFEAQAGTISPAPALISTLRTLPVTVTQRPQRRGIS